MFSRRETTVLFLLAVVGLLSFLTGFDYFLARAVSNNSSLGLSRLSLFLSYEYFICFEILAVIVLSLKDKRAAFAVVASTIILALMHLALTEYAPRLRPPQAVIISDKLMAKIFDISASSSFFSGHTASAVAACTGFALIGYHPMFVLALAIPIITSRITLVHHYFSDIIGLIIIGYVITKIVFRVLKPKK